MVKNSCLSRPQGQGGNPTYYLTIQVVFTKESLKNPFFNLFFRNGSEVVTNSKSPSVFID